MQDLRSMSMLSTPLLALTVALSMAACSQTICQDGQGGTCQEASSGSDGGSDDEVSCDDPNLTSCETACVDVDVDPNHCGTCGNTCAEGQSCSSGSCVDLCDEGQLNCGGLCIDPETNADFCGASGTCTGADVGEDCGENQCSAGVCTSQRYLGSLVPTTGLWNYGGTIGVDGAIAACQELLSEPTAQVCSFAQLLEAQAQGELIDAVDTAGAAVSQWWILDETENAARQCTNTDVLNGGADVPWSYQTAHIGQGAKFANLTAASGSVSQVEDATPASGLACALERNVPCCLP